jgi:hypothetical protein
MSRAAERVYSQQQHKQVHPQYPHNFAHDDEEEGSKKGKVET